jgi:hypothetical protein
LWKKRLGTIKSILSSLAVVVAVLIPLYGFLTNALNEFSKGLLAGAALVAIVAVAIMSVFDFWIVDISEAKNIALNYLQQSEPSAEEGLFEIENTELKEQKWHIIGHFYRYGKVLTTFEIAVDARTGRVQKSKLTGHEADVLFSG